MMVGEWATLELRVVEIQAFREVGVEVEANCREPTAMARRYGYRAMPHTQDYGNHITVQMIIVFIEYKIIFLLIFLDFYSTL